MNKTQYTNAQFATKYKLTALDARAVLGFLASMTAIQIVGGVAKEPGQKGRKERIFEVPDNLTLDMTLTRNKDLLTIPEVAEAPKAPKPPKIKAEKPAKIPKVAKVKVPKVKKSKETPTETPVEAKTETPETVAETVETPTVEAVETTVAETSVSTETAELEAITA